MLTRIERRAQSASESGHRDGPGCLSDRGLLRQWYIRYRLAEEFSEARRYRYPLSLVVLSPMLVGGEAGADGRVRAGALAARAAARSADLIGWLDGDDILVVLPHTAREGALAAVERWRREMQVGTAPAGGLRWLAATVEDDGTHPTADSLLRAACNQFTGID
jgi:hypothetical protein